MRKFMMILVLVLMTNVAWSGDKDFKSAKAKAAQRKHELALKKAKTEYEKKVAAATKTYKKSLALAVKDEMKKGNLEEAVKIKNAVKSIEVEKKDKKKTVKEIFLSQKWMSGKGVKVVVFKDGTIKAQGNLAARWKIEDEVLYIKWGERWDVSVKVTEDKLTMYNGKNQYYWVPQK